MNKFTADCNCRFGSCLKAQNKDSRQMGIKKFVSGQQWIISMNEESNYADQTEISLSIADDHKSRRFVSEYRYFFGLKAKTNNETLNFLPLPVNAKVADKKAVQSYFFEFIARIWFYKSDITRINCKIKNINRTVKSCDSVYTGIDKTNMVEEILSKWKFDILSNKGISRQRIRAWHDASNPLAALAGLKFKLCLF